MAEKNIKVIISAKDQTEAATRSARQNLGFVDKTSREIAQKQAQTFKGGAFADIEREMLKRRDAAQKWAEETTAREEAIRRAAREKAEALATASAERLRQIDAENSAMKMEAQGEFLNAEIARLEEHYRRRIDLATTAAEKEALAKQLALRRESVAQGAMVTPTAPGAGVAPGAGPGFLQGLNLSQLARGAGAAAIFTFAGRKLNTVLDELAKLQAEVASGAITYAEAQEKATLAIVKAIPVVGEFVKAGEKIGMMFTAAGRELSIIEAQNEALKEQIDARTRIFEITREIQSSVARERAGLQDRITLAPLTGGARTLAERRIAERKELEEAEKFEAKMRAAAKKARLSVTGENEEERKKREQPLLLITSELATQRDALAAGKRRGALDTDPDMVAASNRIKDLEAQRQAELRSLDSLSDAAAKAEKAAADAAQATADTKAAIDADRIAAEKALARQTAETVSASARAIANIEAEANETRLRAQGRFAEAITAQIARETEERIRVRREELGGEADAETDDGRRQEIEWQLANETAAMREQSERQTVAEIERINLQLAERQRAIAAETAQQQIQNLRAVGTEAKAVEAAQLETEQRFTAQRERLLAITKDMMATEAQRTAAQAQLNGLAGEQALAAEKAVNDTREQFAQRRETVEAQLARAEIAHLRETGQLSEEQAQRRLKELDTRRKFTEEAAALLKIEQDMALTEEQRRQARELRESIPERQRKALAEGGMSPSTTAIGGASGQSLSSRFMDLAGSARAGDPIQLAQSTLDTTRAVATNTGETAAQASATATNTGRAADAAAATAAKTEAVADATKATEKAIRDMQQQITKLPVLIAAELRRLISNSATLDMT